MKTVYRYEINQAINDVKLPVGAKILSVGISKGWKYSPVDSYNPVDDTRTQVEIISMWALVDTDSSVETRRFLVFGTGADMSATETYTLDFIGTVQKSNQYAFHIFEVNN